MDGLRKRADRWYAIVDFPRHPDGRRNRKEIALGSVGKRKAQKLRAEIVAKIESGNAVEPAKVTFGGYLTNEWLPLKKQQVSPKTFERYAEIVRTRLVPRLGGIPLQRLTESHLTAAYRDWHNGAEGRRISALTIAHIHRIVAQALKRAVRLKYVATNVADFAAEDLPQIEKTEAAALTEEQSIALQDASKGTRLEAPILFAIDTGCRRGEVLALRWEDVDLDGSFAVVRRSLETTKERGLRFKDTKTGRVRVVALDEETVVALRRYRAKQNERRLLLGPAYADGDLVFCNDDGTPWHPDYFGKAFSRLIATLSGFPKVSLHGLRHTTATTMLRNGVPAKVVAERLGHSTTRLTTDRYQHVLAGMDAEAARKAGDARRAARARMTAAKA